MDAAASANIVVRPRVFLLCMQADFGSLHPEAGSCIVAEIQNVEDQMKRNLLIGSAFVATIVVLGVGSSVLGRKAQASGVEAPRFEVDPMWPKPLPNHWLWGNTIGVSVDASDHVWIIHRAGSLEPKEIYASTTPPGASCCLPAP